MSKNIKTFSSGESFDKEVLLESENSPVMVAFFAEWYKKTKLLPLLEEASTKYNFKLIIIDADENQEISNNYNVTSIPYVILFHKGTPVMQFQGKDTKALEKMTEYVDLKTNKFLGKGVSVSQKNVVPKAIKSILDIPEEPPEGEDTYELAFKYNNEMFSRRFYGSNTIGQIKNYVKSKVGITNISIFTPFPRKNYNNNKETLEQAGLSKREMLNVALV